jgi:hypothetical protein
MRVRIGTFNIENLISRNRFGPTARPETAPALSLFDFPNQEGRAYAEHAIAIALEDDKRQMTALAISEAPTSGHSRRSTISASCRHSSRTTCIGFPISAMAISGS